jgi:hypothetical protein
LTMIGSLVDLRSHAISSQLNVASIYPPIVRPRPPPLESFDAATPLMAAVATEDQHLTRSSASRFPCTGPSIVTKMPAQQEGTISRMSQMCYLYRETYPSFRLFPRLSTRPQTLRDLC